jgi:branched-chain amino acid transport system ATP-binding protein
MTLLDVDAVSKQFGGLVVLEDLSFSIDGDVVGLIGPNGAGKTTLFDIITGFQPADSGTVRFDSTDVTDESPARISNRGLVRTFQETKLFGDLSVEENLRIGMHQQMRDTPIRRVLETVRVTDTDKHDEEIADLLELLSLSESDETAASALPYGQQRRLGVGVAVAARPKLLMLDEPVAGMNDTETAELMSVIRRLNENNPLTGESLAVFVIDHDMEALMNHTDRIIAINDGSVIADGDPETVANDSEVIRTYMGEKYDKFA